MASSYPGGLDSFDTIASDKKTSDAVGGRTHRDMHNDLGDAIEAVQAELGTTPSGSYDTVKARFEAIEGSTLPQIDAKGDLIVGTADNTYDNLSVGTNDTVLVADSGQAKGVKWAQVPTAGIADSAVTSAKIANDTIVNADINSAAAIARSKISGLPTSSTDNTIVRFDSTAGAMQTSGVVIDDNNRLTVATGATGGYGFTSGAVHLSGTGSPEGAVTAAPGSTWLQTDATTDVKGWLRWVKATGTGNTGWVVGPEADTGWRLVSVWDTAGTVTGQAFGTDWGGRTSTAGNLRMRRIGNRVHYQADQFQYFGAGNPTSAVWGNWPTGFACEYTILINVSADGAITLKSASDGLKRAANTNIATNRVVYDSSGTWTTGAAWPASLPGSAL